MVLKITLVAAVLALLGVIYSFAMISIDLGQSPLKTALLKQELLVTADISNNI